MRSSYNQLDLRSALLKRKVQQIAMHISSLLSVIHAAHYTWLVQSPWEERGGILVVAPPGQLKTTTINSLEVYPDVLVISDINVRSLKSIRDQILGGRYRTLALGEMEKLYARNPATAQNIEATLKQFVEEGLRHFSFEDSAVAIMPARAFVVCGLTPSMFGKQYSAWNESGFLRRFLRIQYALKDEQAILEAVHKWKKITIAMPLAKLLNSRLVIPYNLTQEESTFIMRIMKDEPESTPTVLLKKIACVLKMKDVKTWRHIIHDVSSSFGKNGAYLTL